MVNTFEFYRTPKIYFGAGKLDLLPDLVSAFGKNVLLITGKESFINTQYWEELINGMKKKHLQFYHTIISGEPTPEMIDSVYVRDREYQIDVVLAIGGGSVLDAGKAISAMLVQEGSVKDYLEGVGTRKPSGLKVPFIAVPTTSGTGSEATKNAVISQTGQKGFKRSIRHENYVPDMAVIDPRLMMTCPARLTADTGMDAFTQLLEAYLSPKSSAFIDALAIRGFNCIARYYERACNAGDEDIEARTGMAFAALTSGIALANAGLGAVHGLAASIGAVAKIPHSVVCGSLMAGINKITVEVLRQNREQHPALIKYAEVGRIFIQDNGLDDDQYINRFIDLLFHWQENFKIPRLSSFDITADDIDGIINASSLKDHPVGLLAGQLKKVLMERI